MSHSSERTVGSHARQIAEDAADAIVEKYLDGQKRHGGELWKKPTIDEAIAEAVDQFTYLHVLREQLARAVFLLDTAIDRYALPAEVVAARNVLRHGNEEGVAP